MEEVHRIHKDVSFGWVKWLSDFMAAQAQARHERALLLWGENRDPEPYMPAPDRTYQLIRNALIPRA